MPNKKTDQEKLEALADAVGESILQEIDEEILEELRLVGINPDAEATRLKALMLDRVKLFQQRKLRAAREGYGREIAHLDRKSYSIPTTAPERRQLFSFLLQQPRYAELVTAQYRDLESLTDNDIETYLEDLAELGVLGNMDSDQTDGKE